MALRVRELASGLAPWVRGGEGRVRPVTTRGVSWPRQARWLAAGVLLVAVGCSSSGPSTPQGTGGQGGDRADAVIPSGESGDPSPGGGLVILTQADPAPVTGWTPWEHVCPWACRNVLDQVLEPLAVVLPDGSVEPWLASSITPSGDLQEWTVVLRSGVTFSDGQALTAAVVKNAFDEFVKEGTVTEGLLRDARVSTVDAIGPLTLVYRLSEPNAGFPALLAGPVGRVFSVDAARVDAAAFLRNPVGTGPFMFESWDLGQDPVVVANPTYWRTGADGGSLPVLDRLTFRQVADEDERLGALRAGQAQIITTRDPATVGRATDGELTVVSNIENNVGAVVFNMLEPPLDDNRVRRALLLASDQQALLDATGVGDVTPPASQWWSPDSIWHSQRVADEWPGPDLDAARALLEEYRDDELRSDEADPGAPIVVSLACTDDQGLSGAMSALAAQWQATGLVDVEVETVSRSGLISRVMGAVTDRPSFAGDYQASCWRLGGESDPSALLGPAVDPVRTSPLNVSNVQDERLVDLVGLVQTSPTLGTRQAAVEQVMLEFLSEVPALYLGYGTTAVIGSAAVEGLGTWTLPDGRTVTGQVGGVGRYDEVGQR